MSSEEHFRKLERMYATAPINRHFKSHLRVSEGRAEVTIPITPDYFHAAHSVHGSIYFKTVDDSGWFAANSLASELLLLTASINIYLTRPVDSGELRAAGVVVHRSRNLIVTESVVHDSEGRQVARGTGTFMPSRIPFSEKVGYA